MEETKGDPCFCFQVCIVNFSCISIKCPTRKIHMQLYDDKTWTKEKITVSHLSEMHLMPCVSGTIWIKVKPVSTQVSIQIMYTEELKKFKKWTVCPDWISGNIIKPRPVRQLGESRKTRNITFINKVNDSVTQLSLKQNHISDNA